MDLFCISHLSCFHFFLIFLLFSLLVLFPVQMPRSNSLLRRKYNNLWNNSYQPKPEYYNFMDRYCELATVTCGPKPWNKCVLTITKASSDCKSSARWLLLDSIRNKMFALKCLHVDSCQEMPHQLSKSPQVFICTRNNWSIPNTNVSIYKRWQSRFLGEDPVS